MSTRLEQSPEGSPIARIELEGFDFDSNFTLAGICKTILTSGPLIADRFMEYGFGLGELFEVTGVSQSGAEEDRTDVVMLHPDSSTRSAKGDLSVIDAETVNGTRVIAAKLDGYYEKLEEEKNIFGILSGLGVEISALLPEATDGDYDGYEFTWATLIQERLDGRHILSLRPVDGNQPHISGSDHLPFEKILPDHYGVQHLLRTMGLALS